MLMIYQLVTGKGRCGFKLYGCPIQHIGIASGDVRTGAIRPIPPALT